MKYSHTIADELIAAGHPGARVSWGDDGVIQFPDDMPKAERDSIQAVFDAHDPAAAVAVDAAAKQERTDALKDGTGAVTRAEFNRLKRQLRKLL